MTGSSTPFPPWVGLPYHYCPTLGHTGSSSERKSSSKPVMIRCASNRGCFGDVWWLRYAPRCIVSWFPFQGRHVRPVVGCTQWPRARGGCPETTRRRRFSWRRSAVRKSPLPGQLSIVVTSFACTAYSGREVYAPGGLDGPLSRGPHPQHPNASIELFVA